MLNVLFFGQLKEVIKTECLEIEFMQSASPLNTVQKLRTFLQTKGDDWHDYLAFGKALVAVNQELSKDDREINDADEIAFFPPVTGG